MAAMVVVGSEVEEEEEELGAGVGWEEVVEEGAPEVIAGRIRLAVVVMVCIEGGWIVIVRVEIISMVVRALRTLVLVWWIVVTKLEVVVVVIMIDEVLMMSEVEVMSLVMVVVGAAGWAACLRIGVVMVVRLCNGLLLLFGGLCRIAR